MDDLDRLLAGPQSADPYDQLLAGPRGRAQPAPKAEPQPGFIPTVKRTGGQMLTSLARSIEDIGGPQAISQPIRQTGEAIVQSNPAGIGSLEQAAESPWLTVKEAVGQMVPQVGAAGVGATLGGIAGRAIGSRFGAGQLGEKAGRYVGGLSPIFVQEYGGVRDKQVAGGQEDKLRALGAAGISTGLEVLGPEAKVIKGLVGAPLKMGVKDVGIGALKQAGIETFTEGTQNVVGQIGAFEDPTTPQALDETALSALMGGIGGGVVGGALRGAESLMAPGEQEKAPAIEEPPPPQLPYAPDPLVVFPDGSVASKSEAEKIIRAREAAARPWMQPTAPLPEEGPLSKTVNRAVEQGVVSPDLAPAETMGGEDVARTTGAGQPQAAIGGGGPPTGRGGQAQPGGVPEPAAAAAQAPAPSAEAGGVQRGRPDKALTAPADWPVQYGKGVIKTVSALEKYRSDVVADITRLSNGPQKEARRETLARIDASIAQANEEYTNARTDVQGVRAPEGGGVPAERVAESVPPAGEVVPAPGQPVPATTGRAAKPEQQPAAQVVPAQVVEGANRPEQPAVATDVARVEGTQGVANEPVAQQAAVRQMPEGATVDEEARPAGAVVAPTAPATSAAGEAAFQPVAAGPVNRPDGGVTRVDEAANVAATSQTVGPSASAEASLPVQAQPNAAPPASVFESGGATVSQAGVPSEPEPAGAAPRQGKIGDKLAAGEVVLTASGRATTPFPKVSMGSNRATTNTVRSVDRWLLENAAAEAQARGDDFNARTFQADAQSKSMPPASKDAAEEYLFGQQPSVVPSILKPLSPSATPQAPAPAPETAQGAATPAGVAPTRAQFEGFDRVEVKTDAGWKQGVVKMAGSQEVTVRLDDGNDVTVPESNVVPVATALTPEAAPVSAAPLGESNAQEIGIQQGVGDPLGGDAARQAAEAAGGNRLLAAAGGAKVAGQVGIPATEGGAAQVGGPGAIGAGQAAPPIAAPTEGVQRGQVQEGRGQDATQALLSQEPPPQIPPAAAPTNIPTEKPKIVPSKNTIFTDEMRESARAVLRSKLRNINSGLDPEVVQAGITIAGYHIEKGARTFAAYAKAMVADLGHGIKPYLKSWYMAAKYDDRLSPFSKEMDDENTILSWRPSELKSPEGRNEVAKEVAAHFDAGNAFPTINEARTFVASLTGEKIEPGTQEAKLTDEAVENGVVLAARKIVAAGREQGQDDGAIFGRLVKLYDSQPNLGVRSSTSIREQAYSTPTPLAFITSRLANVKPTDRVGEPTAGNAALLVEVDPKNAVVNELNPDRADNLKQLGFSPSANDAATTDLATPKSLDVVLMNPPFGAVKDAEGNTKSYQLTENVRTNEVDQAIAWNSLKAMKDDGRAVLLLGGVDATDPEQIREGYRSRAKREFYWRLYNDYNVVDHFTVDGGLYSRQGAGYPVDVVVIRGRGKTQGRQLPAAQLPDRLTSWQQIKERADGLAQERNAGALLPGVRGPGAGVGAGPEGGGVASPVVGGPGVPGGGAGEQGARPAGGNVPSSEGAGNRPTGRPAGSGSNVRPVQPATEKRPVASGERPQPAVSGEGGARKPVGQAGTQGGRPSEVGGTRVVTGERVESGIGADRRGQETETATQVAYKPKSKVPSVGTLVPVNLRDPIQESLSRMEQEHGNLDTYVARELGIPLQDARDYFSAEQVDALAMAIHNANNGSGFIIGDQTGIGKGRVVAGMIRYAMKQGKVPLFVTEKPNLYGDMIRDLDDTGMTDVLKLDTRTPAIFITNEETIPYSLIRQIDGESVERALKLAPPARGKSLAAAMAEMRDKNSISPYKVIFTTYSQIQTQRGGATERMRFIQQLADGGFAIFDESHNAGGTTVTQPRTKEQRAAAKQGETTMGRAAFVRKLVSKAWGTLFSSATYAKRPDVMDLYSSTNMRLAVPKLADLADAITDGGVPMQQIVATMLAKDGQYIRRERTFAGVDYNTRAMTVDRETAENMAESMREILKFSRRMQTLLKQKQKYLDTEGVKVGTLEGGEKQTIQATNFGSVMHNLIDQMLLSLKAKDSVAFAIERLKAGEKVVLTVSNTMGSFIENFADENGLRNGDAMSLNFGDLYIRYLDKQRYYKVKTPGGATEERYIEDEEMSEKDLALYKETRAFIKGAGFGDAPVSPIDYMHQQLRAAGYKTDEITGRNVGVNYETEIPTLQSRNGSIKQRVDAIRGFNNGSVDALILNQSGATGLSLHASSKVQDKRMRHMIIVQPEKNIDTHVQMLGRVHRTGQVRVPAYTQAMADIPAEMRPAAVLLKKMASLNANTTASRKSAVTAEGVVDFMNDYGGQIAIEYLADNPDVHQSIGGNKVIAIPEDPNEANEDVIRKLTGYIPILPIATQEKVYADLAQRYNELIAREDAMGTNKLEARTLDLDAKTLGRESITENKRGDSIFAQPAYMERVDVKRTVKPMTNAEVDAAIAERLGDKTQQQFINDLYDTALKEKDAFIERRAAELTELGADATRIQLVKDNVNLQWGTVAAVLRTYPPGTRVTMTTSDGTINHGTVLDIQNARTTANPVAGSSWKLTLALVNADARVLQINVGQIGTRYNLNVTNVEIPVIMGTGGVEWVTVKELHDRGPNVRRERRYIVTGNILAGYSTYQGQIITYTKDDGTTGQGVLMSRLFNFEKVKARNIKFTSAAPLMQFLKESADAVVTTDGGLRVTKWNDQYVSFQTAPSKREGGRYFLDKRLTEILRTDFFTVSGKMVARVRGGDVEQIVRQALEYLITERDEAFTPRNNVEKAKSILGIGKVETPTIKAPELDFAPEGEKPSDLKAGARAPDLDIPPEGGGDVRFSRQATSPWYSDLARHVEKAAGGLPMFARGEAQAARVVEVQKLADSITSAWKDAPTIKVVESLRDEGVPEAIRKQDQKQTASGAAKGASAVFYKNTVYLVAGSLGTQRQVAEAVFHEVLGHYGLRATFGAQLNRILDNMARVNRAQIEAKAKEYGLDLSKEGDRRMAAEEVLADLAEKRPQSGWVKQAIAAIRTWLRENLPSVFGDMKMSDAELVRNYILPARRTVETGTPAKGEGRAAFQRAPIVTETPEFKKWFGDSKVVNADGKPLVVYHGTTADFDVFDLSWTEVSPRGNTAGAGFFFGESALEAEGYTWGARGPEGSIMPVYLSIKSPYVIGENKYDDPVWNRMVQSKSEAKRVREELVAQGYDGIRTALGEWVAFRPEQIKSATGNSGAFDPTNPDIRFSRRSTELPEWISSGPAALQSAARKFETFAPGKTIGEKFDQWKTGLLDRLIQGTIDAYLPLKRLDMDAYIQARMTKASDGALEGTLLYGKPVLDDDGGVRGILDGKGFLGLMQDLNGEHDRFLLWVAGNRAARLYSEGRENLLEPEEIKALQKLDKDVMTDGRQRAQVYEKTQREFAQFNKAVLDFAEKAGIVNGTDRDQWEAYFYVPFFRVSEDSTIEGPSVKVRGLVGQQGIKRLLGGKDNMGDPLQNTMMNWSHLLSASLANVAAGKALRAAQAQGVAEQTTEAEARIVAKASGFRDGAVYYMKDGQRQWYMVADNAVLSAITSLEPVGLKGPAFKLMQKAKYWLTLGATISPAFKIRNLLRDTVAAPGINQMSYNVLSNVIQGWKGTKKTSEHYQQMMFSGGLMRFGTLIEGERGLHAKRLIEAGIKDQTILDTPEKIKAATTKLWDTWQEFGDRMENVNRSALYDQLKKQGKSHREAAFLTRDLMDFSLHGSWAGMRILTQVVPFLNARIQGLYKLGRAYKDDRKRFATMTGAVALTSIALMLAYKDDDEWKQREDWDRDFYWWFKLDGVAYRIPKPFEIGALGTIAERTAELLVDDEMNGKRYAERLKQMALHTFSMNPVPQLFKPMVDLYANNDSFTGRPIETFAMEGRSKSERTGPSTTALAKFLGSAGDVTGVSPAQIDFVIGAYFGWLGMMTAAVVDTAVSPVSSVPAPAKRWDDWAMRFATELPEAQSRYVTNFYNSAKEAQGILADLRAAREERDMERIAELMADPKMATAKMFQTQQRRFTELSKRIRVVRADREMDGDTKRDRLDELTQQRNMLAKVVMERAERAQAQAQR
jgi:hypothetical protein